MRKLFIALALVAFGLSVAQADVTPKVDQTTWVVYNKTHADNTTSNDSTAAVTYDLSKFKKATFQISHRLLGLLLTNTYTVTFERSLDGVHWQAPAHLTWPLTATSTNIVTGAYCTNYTTMWTNIDLDADYKYRLKSRAMGNGGSSLTNIYVGFRVEPK
jgi:hypothetical protein